MLISQIFLCFSQVSLHLLKISFGRIELAHQVRFVKFGYHLPKDATYRFYYHLLPKNPRRYGKWHKRPVVDDDIKLIKQVYGYNTERALEVLPMLQSNLPALREYAFQGGFGR